MSELRLNETPVRTSQHFGINEAVLKDFEVPKIISAFENVKITSEGVKVTRQKEVSKESLCYGMGKVLEKQISEEANESIGLVFEEGTKGKTVIEFGFKGQDQDLAEEVQISMQKESQGVLVLKYKSEDDLAHYHNGLVRIKAEEGSNLQIILVNLLNASSAHFISLEGNVGQNAEIRLVTADLGGKYCMNNYYMCLKEESARTQINSIYLGKEDQFIDINDIVHLYGKKAEACIEVQGALKDRARKHFKGTLDFKKGAVKSKGDENECCLLLSDTARAKALPILLCTEEDVEGNHSTASGKVGKKELFYLMSRGFTEKEAMKLIIKAKFAYILEQITEDDLRQEILDEIDRQLD